MKRLITFSAFLLAAFSFTSPKASAQITGFAQTNVFDSLSTYCTIPANRGMMLGISPQGTIPANDSVTIYANFGDAFDTTFKVPAQAYIYSYLGHDYTFTGTFAGMVIVTSSTGISDTVYMPVITLTDTCANVSGKLYADNNGNCIYDAGDVTFTGQMVMATNTTTLAVSYTWTDGNGDYNFELPLGYTYDIQKANLYGGYSPSCPVSGIQTLNITAGPYTADLAYQCVTTTNIDLSANGYAWSFRPGFPRWLDIHATSDNYCNPVPVTVTLTLDPMLTYTGTYSGPTPTVSGQVLTWNLPSLVYLNDLWSGIYVTCSMAATLGDTLCNTVVITTTAAITDPNMANNTYNICAVVNNAVDPNNKAVAPKGAGAQGYIPAGTRLSYLVNFQNTGNDTAYNITIKDSLDADVDLKSIQFLESSHPVSSISILPGNVLVFRFDNIMLPDSNINEPASHGFLSYSIKAKTGLAPLTTIKNTAHIYFDFNDAIVTNTTLNTIPPLSVQNVSNGKLSASVYPNPANTSLTVKTTGNFTATLFDILGRPVQAANGNGSVQMNITDVPQGFYLLKINANDAELTTKVNISH